MRRKNPPLLLDSSPPFWLMRKDTFCADRGGVPSGGRSLHRRAYRALRLDGVVGVGSHMPSAYLWIRGGGRFSCASIGFRGGIALLSAYRKRYLLAAQSYNCIHNRSRPHKPP